MKTVDNYLDEINYKLLNEDNTKHTPFTWKYVNFMRLIMKDNPSFKGIPAFHLHMLDKLCSNKKRLVNLCFRGASKTTLFGIYLILYLAVFKHIDGFGRFDYAFYVCDSKDTVREIIKKNIQKELDSNPTLQLFLPLNKQKLTEDSLSFVNSEGEETVIDLFGASSGIRGRVKLRTRPQMIIFDDIITDEASRSVIMMQNLRDLIHSSVEYAVDPNHFKIIFNGTPFHKQDVLYQAVESGVWEVNVYPVCEKFPCSKEEFYGAWEDRFPYEVVKDKYDAASAQGTLNGFQREMMLRIVNEEDRLIPEESIRKFSYHDWQKTQDKYNYYITTDFAVSDKSSADDSVISVWAYSSDGEYLLVDGIAKQQTMDKTVNDLFHFVSKYKPAMVGVENTGQQLGIIAWLFQEMASRKQFFPLARNGKSLGIRPQGDKFTRLNLIVPLIFKGLIKFPDIESSSSFFSKVKAQIRTVSIYGIKGHDDILDTISMLQYLVPTKPTFHAENKKFNDNALYERFGRFKTVSNNRVNYIGL